MILDNRRITIREVAEDIGISFGSCQVTFTDGLGMKRAAAKIVPKLLHFKQKQRCMDVAQELLNIVNDDPDFLKRVITGDESWVYEYGNDIETKAQSSQWKRPEEPRPKKARQVRSNLRPGQELTSSGLLTGARISSVLDVQKETYK